MRPDSRAPLENYQHNDCMSAKLTIDQDEVAINGDLTRYRALLKMSGTEEAQPTVGADSTAQAQAETRIRCVLRG